MPGPLKGLEPYAYFRFRKLGRSVLLTNETGEFQHVTPAQFAAMSAGKLKALFPDTYQALRDKNFVRSVLSKQKVAERYAGKYFVGEGSSLHIVVLTLRCDQACVYCHASAQCGGGHGLDMPLELGRRVVEKIFESPSPTLSIEFQGGEPLLNFGVLKDIVLRASRKAASGQRPVSFSVVSNLAPLTDEMYRFFLKHHVQVCTSLDGPKWLHDLQRPRADGRSSHGIVTRGLKRLATRKDGRNASSLLTVTRRSLPYYREIVDEYVKQGMTVIHLRPLNPLGAAKKKTGSIGYSAEAFVKFYRQALDHILSLNRQGRFLSERTAVIYLTKILTSTDPRYLDLRSPCGAGIGQVVYNHDGDVYTCDEGRMLGTAGDPAFRIGPLASFSFKTLGDSPVVKACCTASCLEVVPGCSECAYKPYCGVCPVLNHAIGGNVFRSASFVCEIKKGILDHLFARLEDPRDRKIFYRWINAPSEEAKDGKQEKG